MSDLQTPVVNLVIGEGGSGGGFGIGLADELVCWNIQFIRWLLQRHMPILWRTARNAEEAAEALKLDADNLVELGIIDHVVKEPIGGAHRNHEETYKAVKDILDELKGLSKHSLEDLTAKDTKSSKTSEFKVDFFNKRTINSAQR